MTDRLVDDLLRMAWGAFAMWLAIQEVIRRLEQERDNYKLIAETAQATKQVRS